MNDSQESILELLRSFAIRCGPHRVVDLVDALTAYRGDHIAALVKALSDPDDEVRLLAVEVLYWMGDEAEPALPTLIESLNDIDRIVRVAAVSAVLNFGKRAITAVSILESWLYCGDAFSEVTAAAAIICIDPCRADVLPVLIDALESEDYGIQCHVVCHLRGLGAVAREAIPALKRLLGDESISSLAREAINDITGEEV